MYVQPDKVLTVPSEQVLRGLDPLENLQVSEVLWCAGDVGLLSGTRRVAVVGTRHSSLAGLTWARKVAGLLARNGIVVVSGLAAGIDGAAHTAAIEAGGRTIAVIGTPLEMAYPPRHEELQTEIWRHHLLVSPYGPGTPVWPSNFLARNKVMARLAEATIVVETGEGGGAFVCARQALAVGRPLFLIQGMATDPMSSWMVDLLARGARIIDVEDCDFLQEYVFNGDKK